MSRRKPKRNARREARASKRGFAERTVRELPAVRITPEGREFERPAVAEGAPSGVNVHNVRTMPRTPAHARATLASHAAFLAGELSDVVRQLRKIESDPDCVSLSVFRSVSEPLRRAVQVALPELGDDVQALAQALRRSNPPPESA